ncbi:hypothetical protein CMEL01_15768 [Colletotrichum melonis]|uniref:Uncharacterized protein n=1 Tax=Colletotrichum melonis TaxID=1209925 RepID=A0AAI9UI56_9PEZI|nr:hypothetical protein CMEL01_15768 [Colletotrichum melonis]
MRIAISAKTRTRPDRPASIDNCRCSRNQSIATRSVDGFSDNRMSVSHPSVVSMLQCTELPCSHAADRTCAVQPRTAIPVSSDSAVESLQGLLRPHTAIKDDAHPATVAVSLSGHTATDRPLKGIGTVMSSSMAIKPNSLRTKSWLDIQSTAADQVPGWPTWVTTASLQKGERNPLRTKDVPSKCSHPSGCAAMCFRLPLVPVLDCGMGCRCQTWHSSLFLPVYISCKRELPMQVQYRSWPPQPQAWRLQRCVSLSAWAVRAGAVVRAARSERRFRWLDDEYRPRLKSAWLRLGGRWIVQDRCDAPELHSLCHSQFSRRRQRAWRSAAAPGLSLPVVCFPPENCLRTRHHKDR